jgi:succinate dehydrogenase / fumarate reductase, membrane anchor subunit
MATGTGTQRTPIGRVRGLGSAKSGTKHWLAQRITAGSNLFLMLWFVLSLALLPDYSHATVLKWLSSPWAAIPLLLLVVSVFHHMRLGLTVVIEDYQHDETRVALLILLNFFVFAVGAAAVFAILKIAFTGAA